MYRADAGIGQVLAEVFDHARARFYHPTVSEDGMTVAGISLGETNYLMLVDWQK